MILIYQKLISNLVPDFENIFLDIFKLNQEIFEEKRHKILSKLVVFKNNHKIIPSLG